MSGERTSRSVHICLTAAVPEVLKPTRLRGLNPVQPPAILRRVSTVARRVVSGTEANTRSQGHPTETCRGVRLKFRAGCHHQEPARGQSRLTRLSECPHTGMNQACSSLRHTAACTCGKPAPSSQQREQIQLAAAARSASAGSEAPWEGRGETPPYCRVCQGYVSGMLQNKDQRKSGDVKEIGRAIRPCLGPDELIGEIESGGQSHEFFLLSLKGQSPSV